MTQENKRCADPECGCHITVFATREKYPNCGERLRLAGRAQLVEFRLTCPNCGYHSSLLTQEEAQVLL